jgi:UDP-N-acetylmuramoyl-L-alanyl-D-glutamate--2,6-diaminopimelate ligase
MNLRDLLTAIRPIALHGDTDREVASLCYDSRQAGPGALFVAIRGFHADGHRFIPEALHQGAAAIVSEEPNPTGSFDPRTPEETAWITVADSREALALLATMFYGSPSRSLRLVGITGTNGKTTTAFLLHAILEAGGSTAGLLGTVHYRIGGAIRPAPHTTPESLDLQRFLSRMVAAGDRSAVMEVSSHALALSRVTGCDFDVAVFTNLTQDHLDFHHTMEEYFDAKLRLFGLLKPAGVAVVNLDDPRGERVIARASGRVMTYGIQHRADLRAEQIRMDLKGISLLVRTPMGDFPVASTLVGQHNVYNLLAAVGAAVGLGISPAQIQNGIAGLRQVPGRFETVEKGQPFTVVVDYAHTEDALSRLLATARGLSRGRLLTVFGCGGDRDRGKRPRMGEAAARWSDRVILTSDNPRTEDPLAILREIEPGLQGSGTPYEVIPDRRRAIARAIALARPDDLVVIAGKGHEDYQIVGTERFPFDDRRVAAEEIALWMQQTVDH